MAAGLSNKEIGRKLSITEGTVKNHVHNALEKLHMDNRIQAAPHRPTKGWGVPRTNHTPELPHRAVPKSCLNVPRSAWDDGRRPTSVGTGRVPRAGGANR